MRTNEALLVLGFETPGTFSKDEIKKAYWALSRKYHPDVNPAGEHLMKQITSAYAALNRVPGLVELQNPQTIEHQYLDTYPAPVPAKPG